MSLQIVETGGRTVLIVDPGRGPQGPPGPQGVPGPPGSGSGGSGTNLLFSFVSPLNVWDIAHGQDTYALVVETFDNNDDLMEAEVDYVDSNNIRVTWYYPTTGYARVFN